MSISILLNYIDNVMCKFTIEVIVDVRKHENTKAGCYDPAWYECFLESVKRCVERIVFAVSFIVCVFILI